MRDQFRVENTLPERLAELGVPIEAVLAQAGLPMALFRTGGVTVSTAELFALYTAIETLAPDRPTIGLELGDDPRLERFDPVALAALGAPSYREAVRLIARYKRLLCPERIVVSEDGQEVRIEFDWLFAPGGVPRALVERCFAWLVAIGRRGTGRPVRPIRLECAQGEAAGERYADHFGCRVVAAEADVLVLSRADFDSAFRPANRALIGAIVPALEAELAWHEAEATTRELAKTVLKRKLTGRCPSVDEVAHELAMSVRTLQRRLRTESTNFKQLLGEARHELATLYLETTPIELAEVAYLLGYEDPTSFHRAFQSWEGTSPGRWRDETRGPVENSP